MRIIVTIFFLVCIWIYAADCISKSLRLQRRREELSQKGIREEFISKIAELGNIFRSASVSSDEEKAPSGERCWDSFLQRFQLGTYENCENESEQRECDELFPVSDENQSRVTAGRPPIAHPNCDKPEMAEKALKCAKNCYICCERPEFNCKNPRVSANFKCHEKVGKCRNHLWISVMKEKCPHTCGLCNYDQPTNGECRDADEFCTNHEISLLCVDPVHRERMSLICPKTCDACGNILGLS